MGLLDILNGMQNGPRGAPRQEPAGRAGERGGMSPWMMALLGMLAYKAVKGGGLGNMLGGAGGRQAAPANSGGLGGMLGGLLGGAAGGTALNGGLRNLLQDMEDNGQGQAARSWVGTGENEAIAPNDLARAIGADDIEAVSRETGMPRDELLSQLSQHLPEFVDRLTPDGRLPSDEEASRW
jgi:uncharacterized protein YidB (DUF937 family)